MTPFAQLALTIPAEASPAPKILWAPAAPAVAVAAMLGQGGRIIGLTAGQFSFLDLVAALLAHTGPAVVRLASWSLAERDIVELAKMRDAGLVTSARIYVDAGLPRYQPEACAAMRREFGPDAICGAHLHAKCATIIGGGWHIAIRTSMNFNRNPRWESFDIDDSPEIAGFLDEHFDAFDRANLTPYEYSWPAAQTAFGVLAAEPRSGAFGGRDMMTAAGVAFGPGFGRWIDSRLAANRQARRGAKNLASLAKSMGIDTLAMLREIRDGGLSELGERIAAVLM